MKAILASILLCIGACRATIPLAAIVVAGCATTTPAKKAYLTVDATTSAVKVAYRAWLDWLVREERRLASLPPIEAGSQQAELLRKEGRAIEALGKYNAALQSSKAAVELAYATGGEVPPAVGLAATELINLITELRK